MLQSAQFRPLFIAFAVIWVGGWGFVMYRYPEFFAKINARFGLKAFASPKHISFTRKLGIIEMVLAALSVINVLVSYCFGLKWF